MTTTALYSGQIEVCISYAGVTFSGAPQIFHFVNGAWVNSTTTVDSANKIVCGVVTSLSPFALFASADQPPADQPPVAQAGAGQTIEATSAAGALVSLNGSGSDPDGDPLTFTWSEGASPLGTGTSIAVLLPIGVHTIALTADDGRGGTGASTVQVVIRDTTPPVLALPAGQTLEATGASGAVASFSARATDSVDGLRPVSSVPSSGSTFALGTTTVTCSASDTRGNTSSGGFAIVVRDTTPPIVTAPANITVAATESGGARGSASASLASFLTGGTAHDAVDPAASRLPPQVGGVNADSTTLFPIGTSTVTFRFRDASGNTGSASATVTVTAAVTSGKPSISAAAIGHGALSGGQFYVDVRFTNTGTGPANHVRVDLLTALLVKGSGRVVQVSPTQPVSLEISMRARLRPCVSCSSCPGTSGRFWSESSARSSMRKGFPSVHSGADRDAVDRIGDACGEHPRESGVAVLHGDLKPRSTGGTRRGTAARESPG